MKKHKLAKEFVALAAADFSNKAQIVGEHSICMHEGMTKVFAYRLFKDVWSRSPDDLEFHEVLEAWLEDLRDELRDVIVDSRQEDE